MADTTSTVKKYLGDLIAVHRHCADAIERQLAISTIRDDVGIEELLRHAHAVLSSQTRDLEQRLQELDGSARWKEAITTVTGFLAGIYGKIRSETLSRALRDDFAALHFLYVCQAMFITTAEACGDTKSSQCVREHLPEIPPLILRIGDCIPAIVIKDLEREGTPIVNSDAAQTTIQTAHEAWRAASAAVV